MSWGRKNYTHRERGGVHAVDQLKGDLAEAQRLLQPHRLAAAERRGRGVDRAVRRKRLVRQPQVQLVWQLVCLQQKLPESFPV